MSVGAKTDARKGAQVRRTSDTSSEVLEWRQP